MDRLDIINRFVKERNYVDFLEIGVFTGYTLDGCIAQNKLGVDPQCEHYKSKKHQVICATSDQFFGSLDPKAMFDLVWIDGLHEANQVTFDVLNASRHLNKGGVIILHDMNPPQYEHTTTGIGGCWTGNCYIAGIFLNGYVKSHGGTYYTIDTDWGVGVYEPLDEFKGYGDGLPKNYWEYFNSNRQQSINLITVDEFLNKQLS